MQKTYVLEEGGLEQLVKDIEKMKQDLSKANEMFADDLVKTGQMFVYSNVGMAFEEDQRTDIMTQTEVLSVKGKYTQKRSLVNNSEKVTYSEFGYGMRGAENPYQYSEFINPSNSGYFGYNIVPGSKKADEYGDLFWFYRNSFGELKRTYGEQPSNLFYFAGQAIKNVIEKVATIRFKNLWGKR